MPVLSNHKHELFCQELAKGKTASEAYVLAGYKANDGNASVLKGNQKIQVRVADLLSRAAVRTEITIATISEMYLKDREEAYRLGQLNVAKGAADSLARLHGLIVDRKEVGRPGDFEGMPTDDLRGFVSTEAHSLGVGNSGIEAAGKPGSLRGKSSGVH